MRFRTTDGLAMVLLSLGLLFGFAQFTVFTAWAVHREYEIYQVGIIWHVLQAGVLFVMLIWIPRADIDEGIG